VLLAIDPLVNFKIIAVSSNAPSLQRLRREGHETLGSGISDVIGSDFEEKLFARYLGGRLRGTAPWQSTVCLPGISAALHATVHAHAGLVLVELERAMQSYDSEALEASHVLRESIADLQDSAPDIAILARAAARAVRALTGYERVIIYRFDADWHGRAIAEDIDSSWPQSLDGLHFPASDIPSQARELYRKSKQRWVASRDALAVPILLDPASVHKTIDLSYASLRSLSPTHLQYHRNMGVNGSMSLSIMDGGRLWGLVVCHHRQPHHPSPGQRVAAAVLTDAFAARVGPAERADTEQARRADLARLAALFTHMARADDVTSALTTGAVTIADFFSSTGAAVIEGGGVTLLGATPPEIEVREFCKWLALRSDPARLFHTDNLAAWYPQWNKYAVISSGLLAIFLSDDRADILLWLLPEEAQLTAWGGNPGKGAADSSEMMPRQSFERWVDTRQGVARPWLPWELEIAESLRHGITDVIVRSLRRIGEAGLEREKLVAKLTASNMELERFAYVASHDMQEPLRMITNFSKLMVAEYADSIDEQGKEYLSLVSDSAQRIQAMVDDLLEYARIGGSHMHLATVDATNELRQVLNNLAIFIAERRAEVTFDDLPVFSGNPVQYIRLMQNLISNGIKYQWEGNAAKVHVGFTDEGKNWRFSVEDNGIGIAEESAEQIFEPFRRLHAWEEYAGTGIGLSVCRKIVENHGGKIWATSRLGIGSIIYFTIPKLTVPKAGAESA
jgi:light-regulated signal transduction histidine kinase (bacteriophytochrome)